MGHDDPAGYVKGTVLVMVAAALTGVATGYAWQLGNAAAGSSLLRLVLLALPFNFVAALVFYFGVRGAVAVAGGGLGFLLFVAAVHLLLTLGIAAVVSGVVGSGGGKIGANVFSWGASYAYGQALHDVQHGTWLGD